MRPNVLLFILPAITLCGCAPGQSPGRAPVPTEALLGTYELVSIEGRPLPVREFQAVYHAGRITLLADQRWVSEIDAETCSLENVCERETATAEGSWVLKQDGTLSFDPHGEDEEPAEEDHGPPPRVEADGEEIRLYTPSVEVPIFTYRRR